MLNLLLKCLCVFASEWFKIQFKFISLKRFNRTLSKTFSKKNSTTCFIKKFEFSVEYIQCYIEIEKKNASNQQIVQLNCKICKQNFNFNNELYEHIRNHEMFKFVKNFHFSINAVNLVCEIEKKSFVSQKSHELFTKSQKSIFEFAITFEIIILLKRSTFQSFALEIASKSTKKLSTCRHCDEIFNFKKSFREHKR